MTLAACQFGEGCTHDAVGTFTVRTRAGGREVRTRLCVEHHDHVTRHSVRGDWAPDDHDNVAGAVLAARAPWLRSVGGGA